MSKQLAISSRFSILATAAVALFALAGGVDTPAANHAGAPIEIKAPTEFAAMPELPASLGLAN